jgi:glutamine amidotransferase
VTQIVGVVDTGRANLLSVVKAIEYIGGDVFICHSAEDVAGVDRVILPGVGAFRDGIAAVRERHFDVALGAARDRGMPVLGICLGMQMLAHTSEEDGQHAGLGWLPADVVRIRDDEVRVPHAGWNDTHLVRPSPMFLGLSDGADFYYTHSYHVQARNDQIVDAVVHHGTTLTAALRQANVAAVQFHPEKSQDHGLQVLTNFLDWDPARTC